MSLDFVAGCLGGCAGVLVGHPFDTVKVNLQTQDHRNPVYRGTFHCLKTIIAKDSFRGLYRGVSSPMGGIAFVNAIVFGIYGNVQRRATDPNSLKSHFYAGAAAGLVQSIICSPMELAKTRLQLQTNIMGGVKFKGPIDCLLYVKQVEGFRGVFRGLGITALRDVPGFSTYFVGYEILSRQCTNPNAFYTLMAGGVAGSMSWVCTVPIDVIKSRLQADGMNGTRQYKNITDCIRKSYQAEGISFLSRGLGSTLIRAFPMNAACFFVVSWVLKTFSSNTTEQQQQQHEYDKKTHGSTKTKSTTTTLKKSQKLLPKPNEQILIVNNVMTTPLMMPMRRYHNGTDNTAANSYHKRETIKGLILIGGAFSEAVCSSEIMELGNDLYDDNDDSQNMNYYNLMDDIIIVDNGSHNSNDDEHLKLINNELITNNKNNTTMFDVVDSTIIDNNNNNNINDNNKNKKMYLKDIDKTLLSD